MLGFCPVPGDRIIPAYAGCTRSSAPMTPTLRDHPRIRGVHRAGRGSRMTLTGSSPHTRGAPWCNGWSIEDFGIIPAYAGCTQSTLHAVMVVTDHPRIRGVHHVPLTHTCTRSGSSPHTRGALGEDHVLGEPVGIIPAYAGCTDGDWGERTTRCGSSPHTRGAHGTGAGCACVVRIIPAYAGCTQDNGFILTESTGSSPHTRGARACCKYPVSRMGIIPAYAGCTIPNALHG